MSLLNYEKILSCLASSLQPQKLGDLLVGNGRLTPDGLQRALARQKAGGPHQRLGRILVREHLATRRDICRALARQWAARGLSALLVCMVSFAAVPAKSARAASLEDVPGRIILASAANVAFPRLHRYPALFGTGEKQSANIAPFTKWSGMFRRFATALNQPQNAEAVRRWQAELRGAQGLPLREMAQRVDDLINSHPYIEDIHNWGVRDYWETPLEFMARGGDCEDFAIAKYASLRILGVPEDHLRIAIVRDLEKHVAHAILIVYTEDGEALVLDNQHRQVMPSDELAGRYQPVYSLNRTTWWLHQGQAATQLASAQEGRWQ